MALATIVAQLKTLLEGADGIATVLDFVPSVDPDPSQLPLIMIDPQAATTDNNTTRRRLTWPVDLVCLTSVRSKDPAADLAIARPIPEAVIGQLDSSVMLGGTLARAIHYPEPMMQAIGPIPWAKTTYIGFILYPLCTIEIAQRFGV